MTPLEQTIRVMIVDDHDQIRRGLSIFLKAYSDLLLVGEASNGREACELCDTLLPDVILMDLVMPHMNGFEATRDILHKYPHIRIIVLTSFDDEELIQMTLDAGAVAYLAKDISADELVQTIRLIIS
jgi:two-component system, NarL family, response regulator LiaR